MSDFKAKMHEIRFFRWGGERRGPRGKQEKGEGEKIGEGREGVRPLPRKKKKKSAPMVGSKDTAEQTGGRTETDTTDRITRLPAENAIDTNRGTLRYTKLCSSYCEADRRVSSRTETSYL